MCTHLNDDAIFCGFSEQIGPKSNRGVSALKVENKKFSIFLVWMWIINIVIHFVLFFVFKLYGSIILARVIKGLFLTSMV